MMFLFVLLVILNRKPHVLEVVAEEIDVASDQVDLFNGVHEDNLEREIIYVDRHPVDIISDRTVGIDYSSGVILDDAPDVIVTNGRNVAVVDNPDHVVIGDRSNHLRGGNLHHERVATDFVDGIHARDAIGDVHGGSHRDNVVHSKHRRDDEGVVDLALLERHVNELKEKEAIKEDFGVDGDELGNLTLVKDKNIDFNQKDLIGTELGKDGYGLDKGELYAYNYPSQGVGAGIGSPAVGAGVGAAGIGAGIGEAVLDGNSVPTLGGVGTYSPPAEPSKGGPALSPPTMGGVGGLVSGAGAGGAGRISH